VENISNQKEKRVRKVARGNGINNAEEVKSLHFRIGGGGRGNPWITKDTKHKTEESLGKHLSGSVYRVNDTSLKQKVEKGGEVRLVQNGIFLFWKREHSSLGLSFESVPLCEARGNTLFQFKLKGRGQGEKNV